jgi:hypothetical protein
VRTTNGSECFLELFAETFQHTTSTWQTFASRMDARAEEFTDR